MKRVDPIRRRTMQAVRSNHTKPELIVRRLLFSQGYRYRLHDKNLPGRPDIVFPGRRKVIFIHGCFWHGHSCKRGARLPKTNSKYWSEKIAKNQKRYKKQLLVLADLDWKVMTLWECQLTRPTIFKRIQYFLDSN